MLKFSVVYFAHVRVIHQWDAEYNKIVHSVFPYKVGLKLIERYCENCLQIIYVATSILEKYCSARDERRFKERLFVNR